MIDDDLKSALAELYSFEFADQNGPSDRAVDYLKQALARRELIVVRVDLAGILYTDNTPEPGFDADVE